MGFLSKLKSSLTGSWADVTLSVAPAQRGEIAAVTVDVAVKSEAIRINRVYVEFRCTEAVKILNYQTGKRDAEEKEIVIDVRKSERLLNEEIVLAGAQELAAERLLNLQVLPAAIGVVAFHIETGLRRPGNTRMSALERGR